MLCSGAAAAARLLEIDQGKSRPLPVAECPVRTEGGSDVGHVSVTRLKRADGLDPQLALSDVHNRIEGRLGLGSAWLVDCWVRCDESVICLRTVP